jgi:hypothetical protein
MLASKLTQMQAEGGDIQEASKSSRERPVNWPLVYDLLADVSARRPRMTCL